ncbi:hypothetical protein ACYATL_07665 [Actinotignum timonense]|uniref:hypothetical protein n=1 Tax=Actinotignum TaxID=1653174 RepID=UPI00254CE820|nr:hypothetical protein [Actinotignum timonense]MDK6907351.1 hypothetical protein [Actinotignum timonense]MDK8782615.1 hypothetical protein [Actinotignum timonense]
MMKKNGGVGLALAGLAILVVGILLGTVWKPVSSVSATVAPEGKGVLVTAPGVLDMGGTDVDVSVSGPAQDTISVGAGFSGDVLAYAEGVPGATITGMNDDAALTLTTSQGEADPGKVLASDMWFSKEEAKGKVEFTYTVTSPGAESLIMQTSSGALPQVELTWALPGGRNWSLPVSLLGLIVGIIGVVLLMTATKDQRTFAAKVRAGKDERVSRAKRAADETTIMPAVSAGIGGAAGADGAGDRVTATGGALGAGILMESPRAQELRERPLDPADRIELAVLEEEVGAEQGAADEAAPEESPAEEPELTQPTEAETEKPAVEEAPAEEPAVEEPAATLPGPDEEPGYRGSRAEWQAAADSGILPAIRMKDGVPVKPAELSDTDRSETSGATGSDGDTAAESDPQSWWSIWGQNQPRTAAGAPSSAQAAQPGEPAALGASESEQPGEPKQPAQNDDEEGTTHA